MLKFFALYKRKITGISNTAFYNQIGIKECSRPGALFFLQNLIVPVSNHFKYLVHESPTLIVLLPAFTNVFSSFRLKLTLKTIGILEIKKSRRPLRDF